MGVAAPENNLILPSSMITQFHEPEIGGKAQGLLRLEQLGAPVPSWCVVPSSVFQKHLDDAVAGSLLEACETILTSGADENAELEAAANAVQQALLAAPLAPELVSQIGLALDGFASAAVAVRSSMVGEDSAEHSFAGQLETYLFQRTPEDGCSSLKRCWAAAFAPRVLLYRHRAKLPLSDIQVGVVIQEMVDGEVSGVLFTADPTTGRRDHTLLSACWGLGEGLVSGICNADEFTCAHTGELLATVLADKDRALVVDPNGPGTREIEVESDRREVACLSDEQVVTISMRGVELATAMGCPQDIEWTLSGGEFYFLQSRPITSLPDPKDGPRVVWDNSNIQESYCGVTTPLTFSFASAAYASVYRQTMEALRIPPEVIKAHEGMLENMLGVVRGRIYYNINNWYRGLLLLPSFGRNKADMEKMMGLEDPVDLIQDEVLSFGEKLSRAPRLVSTFARLLNHFRTLDRAVARFTTEFEAAYARVDRQSFPSLSFSQLMEVIRQLRTDMLEKWHTPIINDFYVMMATGRLRRLLTKTGYGEDSVIMNNLMSGEEGIESTEPTRAIMRMAKRIRENTASASALSADGQLTALADLRACDSQLSADLDQYIERYGDRVIGELKLETISLRRDPSFLVDVLRNFVDRPDLDPDQLAQSERALRSDAEAELSGKLSILGRRRLKRVLREARAAVRNRENMRLARTRMFGLFRDVYAEIGARLQTAGRLEHARDVFYLATYEIDAYHEGRSLASDLGAMARARKAEWAEFEEQDVPHHFETVGPVYQDNDYQPTHTVQAAVEGNVIQGRPCYPGVVTSPVRVVLSPKDDLSVNGRILATVRTDPGWAPLFPTASGILVERGSTLSHSAVLARELGIPAVVGIPGLLAWVSDGDELKMDGSNGRIERLIPDVGKPE